MDRHLAAGCFGRAAGIKSGAAGAKIRREARQIPPVDDEMPWVPVDRSPFPEVRTIGMMTVAEGERREAGLSRGGGAT